MRADVAARVEHAVERLRTMESALVAYSGGVDSGLVLDLAHEALGPRCVGVIARSASLPAAELREALELARERGIPVRVLETREVDLEGYRRNQPDRCYFCKSELYGRLVELARDLDLRAVVDGFNHEDRADWRPGRRAAVELGVVSPLDEAGFTKADVRDAARERGLRNWDKPEAACLSSRVSYGTRIDPGLLGRIESAEEVLHGEGFRQARVRHHEEGAVLEVEPALVPRLMEAERLERVRGRLRELGYARVDVDAAGYRKGSLNGSRAGRADGA